MRLFLLTLIFTFLALSYCRSYSASEQALMLWNKLVGRSSASRVVNSHPHQSPSSSSSSSFTDPIKLKYKGIERMPCSEKAIRNKSCPQQQQQHQEKEQKVMNSSTKIYAQSFLFILLLILFPFFYIIN